MNTSPHDNRSFALAFAVAALQHKPSPEQRMPNSFDAEQRKTDTVLRLQTSSSQSTSGSEDHPYSRHLSEEEEGSSSYHNKLEKSRERNREHARRTRIRKKEHLESLQRKVRELEAERKQLQQKMEECNIASILLGMSSNDEDLALGMIQANTARVNDPPAAFLTNGKRKRFFVENSEFQVQSEPLKVSIDGQLTILGGGCHVNWKTGVCSDNIGHHKKLTQEQLQKLRYVIFLRRMWHSAITSHPMFGYSFRIRILNPDVNATVCMPS